MTIWVVFAVDAYATWPMFAFTDRVLAERCAQRTQEAEVAHTAPWAQPPRIFVEAIGLDDEAA